MVHEESASDAAILQILKWAAGAPGDFDAVRSVDEDALLLLIASHNLYSRFFRRVQKERPRWASRVLNIRAFTLNRFARHRIQQQIASLGEIVKSVPAVAGPVIPIKGLSIYALTGGDDNIRVSGDIDLFSKDPESLWEAMTRLGYATEEKRDKGSHVAVMYRGDVQVEIHRSFPVWSYPPGLAGADMRPEAHPGLWIQPFSDLRETSIHYQEIADESCPGVAPGTQDLTAPNPMMSALLLCVHAFRHYVEGQALESPIVRLGELADIHDLARHPQFDERRFHRLVNRFSAHDAVNFVQSLARQYLGAVPFRTPNPAGALSSDESPHETTSAPMLLSNWSGWTAPRTPDELLQRLNPKDVFDRLEPNRVAADGSWYIAASCHPKESGETQMLSRILVQSPARDQIPARLRAFWELDALRFEIEILRALPPGYRYQVLLYYPYKFQGSRPAGFEIPYSNVKWTEIGAHDLGNPAINTGAAHLSFEWSEMPAAFRPDRQVPIMTLVMKIRDGHESNVCFREDALLMLPLHVIPDKSY
ncbi:nucleotidyltransferase family protein [Capsulimonas corticalis]|uniref:nucleotidyltransferase family protein n=1 Tax=Capsulimonas corticalis TaxID=2219043 RepID=UPI0014037FB1|nr:nucleotidyltransferase family protein [Capsulimonas corticalis]